MEDLGTAVWCMHAIPLAALGQGAKASAHNLGQWSILLQVLVNRDGCLDAVQMGATQAYA